MIQILRQNNADLKREILIIRNKVEESKTPPELDLYKNWLFEILDSFESRIEINFKLIYLNQPILVSEILSETQNLTIHLRALTERYLAPIVRFNVSDLFCLKAIRWLHKRHTQSEKIPFAISDGGFAIYPTIDSPVIYFLPISSSNNLTHTPLIFHEFGHYLYAFHQAEMDSLVKELQTNIWNKCKPSFVGNNPKTKSDTESLKKIVETWYEWTQELFCDAVGLQIGGIGYLKTFSIYLRMMGRGQFKVLENELIQSSHPISWLRIQFLVKRATEFGLYKEANEIEKVWTQVAKELKIQEDYFGFYHQSFGDIVYETLNDMLVEANPISFRDYIGEEDNGNIIQMTNTAWNKYDNHDVDYDAWEKSAIGRFLKAN
jgi:thermostable 8-oxoguanine DNA glycosylase